MTSGELSILPNDYAEVLASLKDRVRQARLTAQRRVNTELIGLYWGIGQQILEHQDSQGWGAGVIRRLAEDLRAEFPQMKGFSQRNLQYMRTMASSWGPDSNVPQAVAQLPWGHIRTILDKAETLQERDWYAAAAVEYGWSRNVLLNMMMNHSMERTWRHCGNWAQDSPLSVAKFIWKWTETTFTLISCSSMSSSYATSSSN